MIQGPQFTLTTMAELFALTDEVEVQDSRGRFDRSIVDEVWENTAVIEGNDSAIWRKDEKGSTICRDHYGNTRSSFGWEIIEGSDGSVQLKAVHFENF